MSAPTEEQALAFAKYHAEHAAHGGAGREFHLRAETFLLELARVSAERDAAVKERDAARTWNDQNMDRIRESDAALAKVKALREALEALPAHDVQAVPRRARAMTSVLLDAIERNQELLSIIERFLDDCCDAEELLINVRAAMRMNALALKDGGRIQ